jgi:hypothetical protein
MLYARSTSPRKQKIRNGTYRQRSSLPQVELKIGQEISTALGYLEVWLLLMHYARFGETSHPRHSAFAL